MTRLTQKRHANVSKAGNPVWDRKSRATATAANFNLTRQATAPRPSALPAAAVIDTLPAFARLTTDEQRSHKAESSAPGTYNIIVNPSSFARSQDYNNEVRYSVTSSEAYQGTGDSATRSAETTHTIVGDDSNIILLSRFEDASPLPPLSVYRTLSTDQLTASTSRSRPMESPIDHRTARSPLGTPSFSDQQLVTHFELNIFPRIFPLSIASDEPNPFVRESLRFKPLHHAICATSLLNLHTLGNAPWHDALERNSRALQLLHQTIRSEQDLVSDGVLFLHFLLLIYDVCSPLDGENPWHRHVQQLLRIVSARHARRDVRSITVVQILTLTIWIDTQACLAGRHPAGLMLGHELFRGGSFHEQLTAELSPELSVLRPFTVQALQCFTELADIIKRIRIMPTRGTSLVPITSDLDRPMANYQTRLARVWVEAHPAILPARTPLAAIHLAYPSRFVFGCGFITFTSCALYAYLNSRSSLSIKQVGRHCANMLELASYECKHLSFEHPAIAFGTFLAGVASPEDEWQLEAIDLLGSMQGLGIGNNAKRAQELLIAVRDEQRDTVLAHGHPEDVDWILLARTRGLDLVDFGL